MPRESRLTPFAPRSVQKRSFSNRRKKADPDGEFAVRGSARAGYAGRTPFSLLLLLLVLSRKVRLGRRSLVREAASRMAEPPKPAPRLSARQRECLYWASSGKTAAETADLVGIATRTVNLHLETSRRKLGAENTTHAVASALRLGLIAL